MSPEILVNEQQSEAVVYAFPQSVAEAVQLLAEGGGEARIVAGGTDVLPAIRKNEIRPRCLVDITRILGLDEIRVRDGSMEVGAAVTFAALLGCPLVRERVPALADAARCVGAQAIQNAATWVGNLVQAMPAADGAIVALALDAEVHIVDGQGSAWHPVESLFLGPGVSAIDPARQLATHVRFPLPASHWGTAWSRLGCRPSLVLPILNCAVSLGLDNAGQRIERARIALGPVSPVPYRARQAESFLGGQSPEPAVLAEAAHLVRQKANPRDSITRASRTYRLAVIPALVEAALATAAQRALDDR